MFPLPCANLESVKEKRVRYQEASALSQALLASSTYQDGCCAGEKGEGILLLPEGAGVFHTEHSERNAMISFAAVLGKPKHLQEGLGRWKGDSSELYVRTSKTVVMAFHQEVADIIRKRCVDCLGDAEALQALKDYVLKKGVSGSDLGHLQWFKGASVAAVNSFEEPEVPPIVSPVDYVVCVAKRNGVRRLHHTSLCGTFKSSSTCKSYVCYDNDLPPPEDYDQVCRKCLKDGTATAIEGTALSSSSSSVSSSTSDSG